MRDRLLTFALAIGALFAFYTLFIPSSGTKELITRPTSTEAGPNGYLALTSWLDGQGVKTVSFRDRYGKLAELTDKTQAAGNLLLSTAPHFYPMRDSEAYPLQEWIEAGNTLLLVVGLSDTPDWSMNTGQDPSLMEHVHDMTGLSFHMTRYASGEPVEEPAKADATDADGATPTPAEPGDAKDTQPQEPPALPEEKAGTQETPAQALRKARAAVDAFQRFLEPQRFEMRPIGHHPLLANVGSVETQSEYPTAKFAATSDELFLELGRETASDTPMLWLLPYGEGQIIVCGYGNVFTNKALGMADNGQLLANIIAASVHGAGKVIIDDAHQGLVAFYDPEAFFGDSRLHRTLWWLLGLWLLFVLGAQRLRAGTSHWSPLDVTTFVRATGGFMARVLKPARAGQRLIRNFLDDVRRRTGLPAEDEPVWEWLRLHGNADDADIARLRQMQDHAERGRRIDLPRLQTLLAQLRTSIR